MTKGLHTYIGLIMIVLLTGCRPVYGTTSQSEAHTQQSVAAEKMTDETNPGSEKQTVEEKTEKQDPDKILELIDTMTIEEKAGQLICMMLPRGNEAAGIRKIQPGGIILHSDAFKKGKEFLSKEETIGQLEKYQSELRIPALYMTDEEGGTVTRVSKNPDLFPEGKERAPREIFEQGGINALAEAVRKKSIILNDLGIHVNLAPVADCPTSRESFIYKRSIGNSPEETAELIEDMVTAASEAGIISCLKHFPGHADSDDTHDRLAIDERSMEEVAQKDLLPFKAGIKAGADMVMFSHVIFPAIENEPASMSLKVHKILRNDLGFDGIAITDDIYMIPGERETGGAFAVKAILAGNDMVITSDFGASHRSLVEAIKKGEISEERLNQSLERILRIKNRIGLLK